MRFVWSLPPFDRNNQLSVATIKGKVFFSLFRSSSLSCRAHADDMISLHDILSVSSHNHKFRACMRRKRFAESCDDFWESGLLRAIISYTNTNKIKMKIVKHFDSDANHAQTMLCYISVVNLSFRLYTRVRPHPIISQAQREMSRRNHGQNVNAKDCLSKSKRVHKVIVIFNFGRQKKASSFQWLR